ncbi:MAG: type II toxin-antitoxin system VapC family toxin [Oscillospiraceae bacterium]|nr:type II toxin-antitoxin system VapC family toxin [Oscillospiraceae bacterium]
MNILLDTHIAVWAITDDPRLSEKAREIILDADNNIYVSAVSTLEVNNKRKSRNNNLEFTTAEFIESCEAAGYIQLPLHSRHFLAENALKWGGSGEVHKDPYDRLLLAQAKAESFRLITHDRMIPLFDEKCIIPV